MKNAQIHSASLLIAGTREKSYGMEAPKVDIVRAGVAYDRIKVPK